MTVVTEREIRSGVNGYRPAFNAAVRAPARARIPVTESTGKIRRVGVAARVAGRRWWVWTARPLSLRAAWRLSTTDMRRVPLRHVGLARVWQVSNATDRVLMFVLILAAPTALTGPLRWVAARPTRRVGFYLLVAAAVVTSILIGHPAGKE